MPGKFLTQIEIGNVVKDLEEENFDEIVIRRMKMNSEIKVESLFSWKEVEDSEVIKVLPLSSKVGLKVDASNFKSENDFFKLMLTDEILAVLVEETNRYAFTVLNLHEETSDKRKHASSWKPTNKNEILKFLGLILLMGHIEKDSIQDYWTTNNMIETPFFRKEECSSNNTFQKNHKQWGLKMYKIAEATGYTYDIRVYLGIEV
ncbi:UNVERIFIED_CONTAM: PiggyBac transposable element-derived protein 4 [Trichonephila clavipes]